ncbi:hypothetical protein QBC40DRAFT_162612 [Triangularia verruculosa]|uniref:Uncharacterized protein n=1 Tax=Triangularia verruculosa TaxID=2587418 RepID=A0AAN6XS63_9PEZI|nr:hypothetical protein QBC40DRAFT_162612 [Triangularia verruculosa]
MKFSHIVAFLTAPLAVAALPAAAPEAETAVAEQEFSGALLEARQSRRPTPCVRDPAATQEETTARFAEFVEVFVGSRKNISRAFEFINHNPMAQNGHAAAWNILGNMWGGIQHRYIRSTIRGDMSWVNYSAPGFGTIVDRFRWEGGCIAEHWDQGERYPARK